MHAQQELIDTISNDSSAFIYIDNANRYYYFEENDTVKQQLVGDVALHQDSLLIYCDSAIKVNQQIEAVGQIIVQQWDSISLFGDTLHYNGMDKKGVITGEEEVV